MSSPALPPHAGLDMTPEQLAVAEKVGNIQMLREKGGRGQRWG